MQKTQDVNILIASQILGHKIQRDKFGAAREELPNGQTRPLRAYTEDIAAAWEVVEKLGMTLLPVENGWFALVGQKRGWSSPAEFLIYLQKADFIHSGAALGEKAPMTICLAAMKALEHRKNDIPDGTVLN